MRVIFVLVLESRLVLVIDSSIIENDIIFKVHSLPTIIIIIKGQKDNFQLIYTSTIFCARLKAIYLQKATPLKFHKIQDPESTFK